MHEAAHRARSAIVCALLAVAIFAGMSRSALAQFGVESFSSSLASAQAGAHANFSTSFALDTEALGNPDGQLRDATFTLPAGLVGNPQAIERCSSEEFERWDCKPASQVGVLDLTIESCHGLSSPLETNAEAGTRTLTVANAKAFCSEEKDNVITVGSGANAETSRVVRVLNTTTLELEAPLTHMHPVGEDVTHVATTVSGSLPLFNVEPIPGHVATFAASMLVASVFVQVNIDQAGQLTATISEASSELTIEAAAVTLWGVPGNTEHDPQRCNELATEECGFAGGEATAFMTNPTSCNGPQPQIGFSASSWEGQSASSVASMPSLTGCEQLTLAPGPSLTVASSTARRDSPAGYEVALDVPQTKEVDALGTPALERIAVTLPPGTSLSPGLANGLQACDEAEFAESHCSTASQVGTVEVSSPLIAEQLKGFVYIGTPTPTEPFRLLLRASASGATITLRGQVEANQTSGQVTTVFEGVPQLPFQSIKLSFFGGATAALANPAACGPATSSAIVSSYAGQTAQSTSTFEIDEDSEGGACPASAPFLPSFTAGTTQSLAGHTSPFTLSISRADGQQRLSSFTASLPPGLVGLVRGLPLCPEPAATLGACSSASEVGTATLAAGAGPLPLYVSGPIYVTGPYDGAPYGFEIAINAVAGPFDLSRALVRSRVLVNPKNMTITIASDPFPQTLGGIPLRIRSIELNLNRPGLLVNPTSCARQAITATIDSSEGASANVSAPFQAIGCAGLAFKPRLTASTQAKATAQEDGASLQIDITNPTSVSASMRSVTTKLPSQLRPRLTTIQKACLLRPTASPASCPATTRVGQASVSSPATVTPLSGPIYLVAHGGRALPSLVVLLHDEDVELELEGTLNISRKGVIDTSFVNLPDLPISSFDLTLTRGPHSILGAVADVCGAHLRLPYVLTGRSGTRIEGTDDIAVSGCPRTRSARSTQFRQPHSSSPRRTPSTR